MSNFNVTAPNAGSGSAISLGGEWTSRDQTEANKYKSALFQHMRQRQSGKQKRQKKSDNGRPRSTPDSSQQYAQDVLKAHSSSPKSAPPGCKPRCERHYEVEKVAGRKVLEPHLKIKRSPRAQPGEGSRQVTQEYALGAGVVMTKSKNKIAVKIDTGLPMDPPPSAPRVEGVEEVPVDDGRES